MAREFLNDKAFLRKLYSQSVREEFVRITALNWDEEPLRIIKGDLVNNSGTINIDANSQLRRTGNLNFVANPENNDLTGLDKLISVNSKIKIEKGIRNNIPPVYTQVQNGKSIEVKKFDYQQEYGDICWFNLGIFVVFDPVLNNTIEGIDISFNFEDKMCLLNGDAGGVIPAAVTFHEIETLYSDGTSKIEYPTIYQIIQELVNHFGKEALAKIIISDLDERIKMTMQYNGSEDYLYYVNNDGQLSLYFNYDDAYAAAGRDAKKITVYEAGSDIGYVMTDFIYPGELICDAGATVTTVLDTIIETLGNYEYFYDVEGNFHFQEKKNYLNTTYTTTILKNLERNVNAVYDADYSRGMSEWDFGDNQLLSAVSNSPDYKAIKNDFVIWGTRETVDGLEIPIRYHLAIDETPDINQAHTVKYYTDDNNVVRAVAASFVPDSSSDVVYTASRTVYSKDYREELYYQGLESEVNGTEESYYWPELKEEFPKVFNLQTQTYIDKPAVMDWWLDIIDDTNVAVGNFAASNIGRRSLVENSNEYNCVFESEIPDAVFINVDDKNASTLIDECNRQGQAYIQVRQNVFDLLVEGGVQNSAYQAVTEALYYNTTMNSAITITGLPIYHLEPNTRITVNDNVSDVHGDFIISTISCPINEGEMIISAYQAQQKM